MHSRQFQVIRNDLKLKRCIMARPKADIPAYLRHSGGLAKVRINSKAHYLGKYGSPESFAKYHAILAAHAAGTLGQEPICQGGEPNIAGLVNSYRFRELDRYRHNDAEVSRRNQLTEMLIFQYADLPCSEFGPLKLAGIRDKLIQRGNCRRYVNDLIQVMIQIFRHGVAREIVPPETLTALEALPALRRGEAHDNPPRRVPTLEDFAHLMRLRLLARRTQGNTKAVADVADRRPPEPVAARRPTTLGGEVPTAATEHAARARCSTTRVRHATTRVISVPILAPLPNIPMHIVQPPGIG